MSRVANFSYQDPTQEIGSSLATAIFGNPAEAAKQRDMMAQAALRAAQTRQADAHGALYTRQGEGVDIQNNASTSLPELFKTWAHSQQPAPPPPTTGSPGFANFDAPMPQPEARPDPTESLAALIGAMGQVSGDKIDPTKMMGAYGAFGGGDEMARRALVVQGHTPGENFALTPQRADEISARDAGEAQTQAFGTARINHATDIPVANIRRASAFDVAGVGARSRETIAEGKANGTAPGFDAITLALPGATMSSGWRSAAHNKEVGGVANSEHLGGTPGVQAYDVPAQPGMTVQEAAAKIEEANGGKVRVIEARDERGRVGPNGVPLGGWHFALQSVGGQPSKSGKSAAAKPPKPVSIKDTAAINTAMDDFLSRKGLVLADPVLRATIMARAVSNYQQSGNISDAILRATSRLESPSHPLAKPKPAAAPAAPRAAASPPMQGARQAPDGNWYVQSGKNRDGSPKYSKVIT